MAVRSTLLIVAVGLCLLAGGTAAAEIRVAVAANFAPTLHRLAEAFTAATGHRLLISSASTGKHYAQIRNGAAFDIFLAADAERPARLEREGLGVAGSRFAYAEGRLALWVPDAAAIDDPAAWLTAGGFRRLAIAHPRLAPYGRAAQQLLEHWGLWDALQTKLVRGENVGQAFQFVATGNAQAGLIALSQVIARAEDARGGYRVISAGLHMPIAQHALLLRTGPAAEAFLRYLKSAPAVAEIRRDGYAVPEGR